MKEFTLKIGGVATLLLIGGCSKDSTSEDYTLPQGSVKLTASVNQTRTSLDGNDIMWQAGDKLGLFYGTKFVNEPFTTTDDQTTSAEFTGDPTDENGNPVITPGSGTTSIGMTVTIGEDGIIAISDIKDTTVPSSGPVGSGGGDTDTGTDTGAGTDTGRPGITESGSAQTGDSAQPAAWIVCMITSIAFACLTVMGIQRKRKENENIGK